MPIEDLVRVDDAAKAVGLSKFTLYKAAKAGQVPFYKQGKALRFSIRELLDAMRRAAGEK
jgi:excisionase family DNA binding protein